VSRVPVASALIRRISAPTQMRGPSERPRPGIRPLDDDSTELVTVLEFIWSANDGQAVQPVLWLHRELLH
jgi:hypothetical protein